MFTVDRKVLARQTIPRSIPLMMTIGGAFDVGIDTRTPVHDSYKLPYRFTGKINKLTFKLGPSSQLSVAEHQVMQERRSHHRH